LIFQYAYQKNRFLFCLCGDSGCLWRILTAFDPIPFAQTDMVVVVCVTFYDINMSKKSTSPFLDLLCLPI
jgi:hypothetical protein